MKLKKFISFLLALTLCFSTLACGIVADAASYNATVLQYMLDNHDSYPEARFTPESYAIYTAALTNAQNVNENPNASAEDISNAVSALAAGEAALTVINSDYTCALDIRVPSVVESGKSFEVAFKDAASNEITNIVTTVNGGVVASDFIKQDNGYYLASITSTGITGNAVTVEVSYDLLGAPHVTYFHVLISADGEHTAIKNDLGAKIARELAKNRQVTDYNGGFSTYINVMANAIEVYANPSATQTRVQRAKENIDLAVNSLVSAYADYSRIYALVAQVNELNPDNYNSFIEVTNAIALIQYDLPANRQAAVDQMADNIESAISGLTLKMSRYTVLAVTPDATVEGGYRTLSSQTYDGTRTYVVRVTAPVHPGYEADVQYQTVVLDADEKTVTFVYEPVIYYAYFNANGGTVDVASKQLTYLAEYGELPVATRDGYSFIGWFSDPYGGEQIIPDTMVTVNYVENLYAHWSDVEKYTFTFDSGEGTACENLTAAYGTEIEMPVPYRYGYSFTGWYYDKLCTKPANYTVMPDLGDTGTVVNLYAGWTEKVYNITLDPGENGTVSTPAYSVTYGSTYGDLPKPVKDGHTFVGWFTAPEGGNQITAAVPVELETEHTLYAQYTVNTYTLYFDTDGGSEIAPITALYGTPIEIEEPTKMYYLFAGWTLNGEAYELSTMPSGNVTVKAVWNLNTVCNYYLDAYKTINGVRVPATSIKAGDKIEVEVSIKTNYLAGQGVFGIMFDNRVFSMTTITTNVNTSSCVANTTSAYIKTLGNTRVTGSNNYTTGWAGKFADGVPLAEEHIKCARIQTGAGATSMTATKKAIVVSEKTLVFTMRLTVNSNIDSSVTEGLIFIDKRMCKSPDNSASSVPTSVAALTLNETTNKYSAELTQLVPELSNAMVSLDIAATDCELAPADGSTTVVENKQRIVYGLAEELTLDSFKTNYAQVIGTGTIVCEDAVLGTGSVIKVMEGSTCRLEYTVVIYGDLDGNGTCDANDSFLVGMINNGLISLDRLNAYEKMAADPNHDGVVNASDAMLLNDAALLKQVVSQVAPTA